MLIIGLTIFSKEFGAYGRVSGKVK